MLEAPFLGQTINKIIKKFKGLESLNARRKPREDQEEFSKRIKVQKSKRGYLEKGNLSKKLPIRKVTNRPRVGILRAKWLAKLEQEESINILPRFEERYIKGYYEVVTRRYFLKERSYILIQLY